MKILVLYDKSLLNNTLLDIISSFDYEIDSMLLDCNKIKPCLGCFKCWVKTPGSCIISGDIINTLTTKYMNSDIVIILSQIVYGGYSSDIKSFLDRIIPIISPIFIMKNKEMHHKKRYEDYPSVLTIGYGNISLLERNTFMELIERNALNLHPKHHKGLILSDIFTDSSLICHITKFINKVEKL